MDTQNDSAKTQLWNLYQFVFQNADTVDEQLLAVIREMIASLDLQKESLGVRYNTAGTNPLKVDVYIETSVDRVAIKGLMVQREERIFPIADQAVKKQDFASSKNSSVASREFAEEASNVLSETEEEPQVESVTFKGALPNPPSPTKPV